MTVETELKLSISPEHLARLKRHPLLRSLSSARAGTRKLHSVYFDTPDLYLHKHAMAIRLRRVGQQWRQALKGGGEVQVGLHLRNEWETAVSGEALDFAALEACGAKHLPKRVRKSLQAVFVTDFSRTARMLNFEGAQIELCMDSGEIRSGRKVRQFAELELELKSGAPLQLFRLAMQLQEIVPLDIEAISKAEYGYRLWLNAEPEVASAEKIAFASTEDAGAVLQRMIWSCLRVLQADAAGAVHNHNDEYLHQMRVALRRLRIVMSMANRVSANADLGGLRSDVAALGVELGRSREWDVFVTQTLAPLRQQLEKQVDIGPLLRSSELRRRKQHKLTNEVLQSAALQRLLLRFGVWMNGDYWQQPSWQGLGLHQFSAQILKRRSNQVRKRFALLTSDADSGQLHILRISCKKLRYSAELFAPLFSDKKVRCYLSALAKIQDNLGQLNDIAIARRLLEEIGTGKRQATAALIRGWLEHGYAEHLADLYRRWQQFSRCDEFWS
jgi:triphosphatase